MATSFDPSTFAAQLAGAYTQNAQAQLKTQTAAVKASTTGLSSLSSALSTFRTALSGLSTSSSSSLVARSATVNEDGFFSATANGTAQTGSYSLFVERVATTHQMAYSALPASTPATGAGTLAINRVGGGSFSIDLAAADRDAGGTLTPAEIAAAINQHADNDGSVVATVINSGNTQQLVLASGETGANARFTVDASAVGDSALQTALGAGTTLKTGDDAVVWLGEQNNGVRLQQATNSFTAFTGVTLTLTKAMTTGAEPLTLTIAGDNAGTAANVKKFVDAYNALRTTLDSLTKKAGAEAGSSNGALANDASTRGLRDRVAGMLRESFDGATLADFGVSSDRNGKLSLNNDKLQAGLTRDPAGLDKLFGSTRLSASSGLLGALDNYTKRWTDSGNGQIQERRNSLQVQQARIDKRQERVDAQYNSMYARYLAQFTQLQSLQNSMGHTGSLFTNLSTA